MKSYFLQGDETKGRTVGRIVSLRVSPGVNIEKALIMEDNIEIRDQTEFEVGPCGYVKIESGVIIGRNNWFQCNGGITIRKGTISGPNVVWLSSEHTIDGKGPIKDNPFVPAPLLVGINVWIGANCTIRGGVTIREGAVIGANSFVNRDVGPFEVVGGVPARHIKWRK